jgi:membrane-associated phospholipid phosphatase
MNGNCPTRWQAARASLSLSLFFIIVYGACNHFTAMRSDIGTCVYGWERHIPFVPLMIVPYLSIDLLFVFAPFLCEDRRELRLLSSRILLAIVVAAAFFLAMPLRFTFERPPAPGLLGVVFDWFRGMDKPFNQFPSLHIALRTILADIYARRARWRFTRVATHVWFSLIGASTLLVYQHHVIDVVGGFALGAVCFYALADVPWRSAVSRNRRVSTLYATVGVICAVAAFWLGSWGLLLLWPAIAMLLVACGYFGLGPAVYRKAGGRLPLGTRVLLAPVLLAHYLSLLHYARRSNAWDKVTDCLWIGRWLHPREARRAAAEGVTAVLDLTCELAAPRAFRGLTYLNVPLLDLTAPLDLHFNQAMAFIDKHCNAGRGGVVYIHCKAGYSRSAAVVAAYLLHSGAASTPDDAINMLRAVRPGIVIRPEAMAAIRTFHGVRR